LREVSDAAASSAAGRASSSPPEIAVNASSSSSSMLPSSSSSAGNGGYNDEAVLAQAQAQAQQQQHLNQYESGRYYKSALLFLAGHAKNYTLIDQDEHCLYTSVADQVDNYTDQGSLRSAVKDAFEELIINNNLVGGTEAQAAIFAEFRDATLAGLNIVALNGELSNIDRSELQSMAEDMGDEERGSKGDLTTIRILVYLLRRPIEVWDLDGYKISAFDDPLTGELGSKDPISLLYDNKLAHFDIVKDAEMPCLLPERTLLIRQQHEFFRCAATDANNSQWECGGWATTAWQWSKDRVVNLCPGCNQKYKAELSPTMAASIHGIAAIEDFIQEQLVPVLRRNKDKIQEQNCAWHMHRNTTTSDKVSKADQQFMKRGAGIELYWVSLRCFSFFRPLLD
jgi:hypothetical protein